MRRILVVAGALTLPAVLLVAPAAPTTAAACTISGTDGDDVLTGTPGPDRICGLGGNDRLVGLAGDDVLLGGAGNDVLVGSPGSDRLFGGPGAESLVPGTGDDEVDGGSDRDKVSYRDVAGGVDVDLALGAASGTTAGTDALSLIEGVTGTAGDDTLAGTAAMNFIDALGGDDVIRPGGGSDVVHGNAGTDRLDYSALAQPAVVRLTDGATSWGGRVAGVEDIVGTSFPDHFVGTDGPNTLVGGGGDDGLSGGGGDDVLAGGAGDDSVTTGAGNDDVDGGVGEDSVRFPTQQGRIWVDLSAGTAVKTDDTITELSAIEVVFGTWSGDHLYGGLGATEVAFYGFGGADDINTQDGFGGDWISADSLGPSSTCVGDPGDLIHCESE